ncbi:MAG: aldo/keto reductase [Chloroflexota bacterium]
MEKRKLGKLNEWIAPLGLGCAAIGGFYTRNGRIASRGDVDDQETIRAVHAAIDHQIQLFDVANIYGAGHAERVLGQALQGKRERAILQVKFGASFDEVMKAQIDFEGDVTETMIRHSLEGSLRRLQTDYVDIFQFQNAGYPKEKIPELLLVLERLVAEGKIRSISFGTPNVETAELFAASSHCATIITGHNVFMDVAEMLAMLARHDVALLAGVPLFMGFLSGKYNANSTFDENDLRATMPLQSGGLADRLEQVELLRDVLCENGRSLVQGAICWLWSRHSLTIPLPGFKTVAQVEELAKAASFGSFNAGQMDRISQILG